jgi:GTPase SAR1 family protein
MECSKHHVAVVGGSGVGKTTLIQLLATTFHEFIFKEFNEHDVLEARQTLGLYHAFILVCDTSSMDSFTTLSEVIPVIKRAKEGEDFPCVLVGNKTDIDARVVSERDLAKLSGVWLNSCPTFYLSIQENISKLGEVFLDEIETHNTRLSFRQERRNSINV